MRTDEPLMRPATAVPPPWDAPPLADPPPQSADSLITVFARRQRVMVTILLGFLLAGVAYIGLSPRTYQATCNLLVVTERPATEVPLLAELRALTRGNSLDTQLEILQNPALLQEAFFRLPPRDRLTGFGPHRPRKRAIRMTAKPNTDIITITVQARTPRAAAAYANTIAATYLAREQAANQHSSRQARRLLDQRLRQARTEHKQMLATLATYQQRTGLVNAEIQFAREADNLAALQLEVARAQTQVSADKRMLPSLRALLDRTAVTVVSDEVITRTPQYATALQQLEELHADRARLLQEFTPQSIELRTVDLRIAQHMDRLQEISELMVSSKTRGLNPIHADLYQQYAGTLATAAANTVRLQTLTAAVKVHLARLHRFPALDKRLTELLMNSRILQEKVSLLEQQYQAVLLNEDAILPNGRIVAPAQPLATPATPNPRRTLLLVLLLGIGTAVLGAFASELLDRRIPDRGMAERLARIPCVGAIPRWPSALPPESEAPVLEEFCILYNNLASTTRDPTRLCLLTSPDPGAGKTLCSKYLALAAALYGQRVLLVDGNLRHPAWASLNAPLPTHGWVHAVTAGVPLDDFIVRSDHARIDLLPSGQPTGEASAVYAALRTRAALQALTTAYDAIIIDGPSCATLSDVQVLANLVDSVVLIVAEAQTTREAAQEAGTILRNSQATFIGLVMNKSTARQRT